MLGSVKTCALFGSCGIIKDTVEMLGWIVEMHFDVTSILEVEYRSRWERAILAVGTHGVGLLGCWSVETNSKELIWTEILNII